MASQTQFAIYKGDSKDKLLAQLGDIGRIRSDLRPVFNVIIGAKLPLIKGPVNTEIGLWINGLVAEDGSGNCWIISGYVIKWNDLVNDEMITSFGFQRAFEGFYNTRTRQGWLKPRES